MKRNKVFLVMLIVLITVLNSCNFNAPNNIEDNEEKVSNIVLNKGSCFVYIFKDDSADVWYVATDDGITPRLNTDGSLYSGNLENEKEVFKKIKQYQILLNNGSCFIYTFKDESTGVWYISTSEAVIPRLNTDGTLYVE